MHLNPLRTSLLILAGVLFSGSGQTSTVSVAGGAPRALAAEKTLEELEQELKGQDQRRRREAVQDLAKLGGSEAWALILEVLGDPEPQVADEAQMQLEQGASAELAEELCGKAGLGSKDSTLRLRAVQVLGQLNTTLEPAVFSKVVKDKDPEVRRACLVTLEALAARNALGDKGRAPLVRQVESAAGKDKLGELRAQAWVALAALESGDLAERMNKAWGGKDLHLRLAALDLAGRATDSLDPGRAQAMTERALADPARLLRARGIENLAVQRDRKAAELLVGHLAVESDTRLAWRVVDLLRGWSALRHGRRLEPWRAWVEGLDEDWQPLDPSERESEEEEGTASFAGLSILSDHVVFLIDFSGSTWEKRDEGSSRKEVLDGELRRALSALPESASFNLIPFTNEPHPWKDSLVPATKKNVRAALDWFESCKHQGKGNFWDAALLALDDPGVDTVLTLTDGAPTGGTRWNMDLMGRLMAERNRFRLAVFDTVLVDARERLVGYWERISRESGGRTIKREL